MERDGRTGILRGETSLKRERVSSHGFSPCSDVRERVERKKRRVLKPEIIDLTES